MTATVAPSGIAGPITFYDGEVALGSAPLSGGQAVLTYCGLLPGTHSLRAGYSSQFVGQPSTVSSAVTHTVNALAASALTAGFPVPVAHSVTVKPKSLAVGDFNRDGKPDLAFGDSSNLKFGVRLGNADGTFQPEAIYGGGGWSGLSANPVADLNQDGNLDLVAVGGGIYEPRVWRGIGNGTFEGFEWGNNSYGYAATSVALGDVNHDGKIDHIVATGSQVAVLLGYGDGRTAQYGNYIYSVSGYQLATGDFNADGNPDVVVVANWLNRLSILLGNGDGSLQPSIDITTSGTPEYVTVGDFNRDGKLDLTISHGDGGNVSMYLGRGDGTFLAPYNIAIGGKLSKVLAADLNGDGKLDLAVFAPVGAACTRSPWEWRWHLRHGPHLLHRGGSSRPGRGGLQSRRQARPCCCRLNGAEDPPVPGHRARRQQRFAGRLSPASTMLSQQVTLTATVTPTTSSGFVSFSDGATPLGTSPISSGKATLKTTLLSAGQHFLQATYSGDGVNYAKSLSTPVSYWITIQPVFAYGPPSRVADYAYRIVEADFNRDGRPDVALYHATGSVSVLLGQGDGTFVLATTYSARSSADFMLSADFNLDGNEDILTGGDYPTLALGHGDGRFDPPVLLDRAPWNGSLTGDINGDGRPDLVSLTSQISVRLGIGDGTFEAPITTAISFFPYYGLLEDLNGDGKADLLATSGTGGYLFVLIGNGDGTFRAPARYPVGANPLQLTSGDFNGDGKVDIAVLDSSGSANVLIGVGDGTLENYGEFQAGGENVVIGFFASGDLNSDGKTDLIVARYNSVRLMLGYGDGTFQPGIEFAAMPASSQPLSLGDLNGDGRPDLIVNAYITQQNINSFALMMAVYPSSSVLAAAPNPAPLSQEVTLTANVTPSNAGGSFTFVDGSSVLGYANITGGQAVLKTKWLSAGQHSLKAVYSGDPLRYVSSTSPAVSFTVASFLSGGFGTATTVDVGRGPQAIVAADFNGDGKQDFATVNALSNTISVLIGNGDGTFRTRVSYNVGEAPRWR